METIALVSVVLNFVLLLHVFLSREYTRDVERKLRKQRAAAAAIARAVTR